MTVRSDKMKVQVLYSTEMYDLKVVSYRMIVLDQSVQKSIPTITNQTNKK